MNDASFFQSFIFRQITCAQYHHADMRMGTAVHYVGYLKEGHARLEGEKNTLTLQAGDYFYIPRFCRYQSYWYGAPVICFDSFGFQCCSHRNAVVVAARKFARNVFPKPAYVEYYCRGYAYPRGKVRHKKRLPVFQ